MKSTRTWPGDHNPLFNPKARISRVPLFDGAHCVVVDDALAEPEAAAAWAATQSFEAPVGYPYPGLVCSVPGAVHERVAEFFSQHVRSHLGGRRLLDTSLRMSLVCTPAAQLQPVQWLCHRDRVADDPQQWLFAASVLYLFRHPGLGGTSFYRPLQDRAATDRLLADSQRLGAAEFTARHGLQAGYMGRSNAWFERVAGVGAAWNRAIFYDGGLFHSADVERPELLSADPHQGRLTLNGFFTCRRNAR